MQNPIKEVGFFEGVCVFRRQRRKSSRLAAGKYPEVTPPPITSAQFACILAANMEMFISFIDL